LRVAKVAPVPLPRPAVALHAVPGVQVTDSARSVVWGDGVAPNGSFTGTGTGAAQSSTVYGRVPTGQGAAAIGSYSDTVVVTITY
jgi:spore coat protein U-like protein